MTAGRRCAGSAGISRMPAEPSTGRWPLESAGQPPDLFDDRPQHVHVWPLDAEV